jgi:hypothetical protein
LRVTFGALPRFGVADLPRRDFTAPERRFIALPKVRTGIVAAQISAVEVAGQAFGLITSAGRAALLDSFETMCLGHFWQN